MEMEMLDSRPSQRLYPVVNKRIGKLNPRPMADVRVPSAMDRGHRTPGLRHSQGMTESVNSFRRFLSPN